MSETVLQGAVREAGRKGPARRLRMKGMLPGVVYGRGENVLVAMSSRDILKILGTKGGVNKVITTSFEGDGRKRQVMIKDLDYHPLTDTLVHVDLLEIDVEKPVRVAVALDFGGVPKGVKEKGGRLAVHRAKLNIECMPADIPSAITVSIKDLDAGEELCVKDIDLGGGIKPLDEPGAVVVSVAIPKVAETAAEGAAEGAKGEAPAA